MSRADDMPFKRILAVDTSTMIQTIAVFDDGQVLAERTLRTRRGHAAGLLGGIDEMLEAVGVDVASLDLLVAGAGPGSFTGLRIGLACLKGLAFAKGKPMLTVSSLAAISMQAGHSPEIVVPIIDARKGEFYAGLYSRADDGLMSAAVSDKAYGPSALLEKIRETCSEAGRALLLGPGAPAFLERIPEEIDDLELVALEGAYAAPRAAHLALLAARRRTLSDVPCLDTLEPNYQRLSDAEINFKPKQKRSGA